MEPVPHKTLEEEGATTEKYFGIDLLQTAQP